MKRWLLLCCCCLLAPPAWAGDPLGCGSVVFPPLSDITSFSPLTANSIANQEAAQLQYLDLVWINRYGQVDWPRSLARAIKVSADGTVYDVTLRPWRWSDGVAVTTADVLYDFKLISQMDAITGPGSGGMPTIIKSLTASDATHFRIVLTHPANPEWFIDDGMPQIEPVPEHAWSRYSLDQLWQLQSTPAFFSVVDGPLRVQRYDDGSDAIYVPNPNYPGPKMHLSRFVFDFIESDGTSVQQIEAGNVDMVQLPTELWKGIANLPGIHIENLAPATNLIIIALNLQNARAAFFQDWRVRQAMQDALDQGSLVRLVLHGYGSPDYSPVPPGEDGFLAPALKTGGIAVGYDPVKARALLEQAGFHLGSDGIMQKSGKKLAFLDLMSMGSAEYEEITEFIQSDLRQVGIEMDVREMDFNQVEALISGAPSGWQAAIYQYFAQSFPSGEAAFETGGSDNTSGYSDRTMDGLIAGSINRPGLQGLYAYEQYASAQQPAIFMVSPASVYLVRNRLHGTNDFLDPAGQLSPDQLWCTSASKP